MERIDLKGVSTGVIIAVITAVAGYLATLSSVVSFDWKELGIIALSAFIGTLAQKLGTNPKTERFAGSIPAH